MNKAEKSLRWVVNQIPDLKPATNEEKTLIAIKLYSEAGAEEIRRLEVENASLHEKFAALNEMPCNIGDTVYVLFGSCYRCEDYAGDYCSCEKRGKDKIFEMKVGSVRFDKDNYYLYEDPIGISSGLSCSGRNYRKTWFLSMEEAKIHVTKSYDSTIQRAEKGLREEKKDEQN